MTIDELHKENARKLAEILDLEEILYDTRTLNIEKDNSPCWCILPDAYNQDGTIEKNHSQICQRARAATRAFWKR